MGSHKFPNKQFVITLKFTYIKVGRQNLRIQNRRFQPGVDFANVATMLRSRSIIEVDEFSLVPCFHTMDDGSEPTRLVNIDIVGWVQVRKG